MRHAATSPRRELRSLELLLCYLQVQCCVLLADSVFIYTGQQIDQLTAAMAAAYGPLEIPSWAIGAIFFFFLIVTLIWDKMLHALEHYLKKRNKPALSKALQGLKVS